MRRLLVLVALAGCTRSTSTAPSPVARVASSPPPSTADAGASVGSPPPSPAVCAEPAVVDTIDDGEGILFPTGSMDLGDVQVIADGDQIGVSWTRHSNFLYGDSWRSPSFASRVDGTWKQVKLPTLAYACALYGSAAVNTIERPFVSWGVANNGSFEVFDHLPALKNALDIVPAHSNPVAEVTTPRQTVDHFVVSRNVALAMLFENACEPSCLCASPKKNISFWVRRLDPARSSAQRVSLMYEYDDKAGAPAIAMGEHGGIVAYRARSKLHLAWLDADGRPLTASPAVEFDSGDVGAPAVAMAGDDAIVVWASRASKADAYQLRSLRLTHGASPGVPAPLPTAGSAFAPSVVADAGHVTLAWMEGDGGRHGEIHVARSLTGPSVVVSGDETNARDPELSGDPSSPAIVWQSFTKERVAGVIKVARLDCGRRDL